jgi:hypothetical protein
MTPKFRFAGAVRVPALENGPRGWEGAGTADPGGGPLDPAQDQVQ